MDDVDGVHQAIIDGDLDRIRYLMENGTDPDPFLHFALRHRAVNIVFLLLNNGADFERSDTHGDYPIHIACANGLLDVVHALCTFGCSVEIPNANGLYPLHLAAKYGHIDVVRCLCAAGCNINVRNSDNIRADITALKYRHNEISELLDKLRATGSKDGYARQLVPTSKPATRLSLRLFGNCGVGKTALAKSLGAGLFTSLFKRSSSIQSNKSRPSSPINNATQIEMDVTSRQNSLNFESSGNYQSTNGIRMQMMDISNVGDVCIWEYSGQENYFTIHHHFMRLIPQTLTAVLFSLEDTPNVQIQQVCYWLNFILARQPADLTLYDYGQIVLVATHVDMTRSIKNQNGEWQSSDALKTLETVKKLMPHLPNLMDSVIVMDANVPASYAFKQLKSMLLVIKQESAQQSFGSWTGLLESTLNWLPAIHKIYEQFPVIPRAIFAELLRRDVNILSTERHIDELLYQLHAMGELFTIADQVILSVDWLGHRLLADLLSVDFLARARPTGVYTVDDFQSIYTQSDARAVLDLCEAFDLCVGCDVDGELEYEFPVYNRIGMLDGLWERYDEHYAMAGLRLCPPRDTLHLLSALFPHVQVALRRSIANDPRHDDLGDLYQWHFGSKLCDGDVESMITLERDPNADDVEYYDIRVRGPDGCATICLMLLETIRTIIFGTCSRICPGLILETHILSVWHLRQYTTVCHAYTSHTIANLMLNCESTLDVTVHHPTSNVCETLIDLLLFGDVTLLQRIEWGCALRMKDLAPPIRLRLAGLLDPPESCGRDWCMLAMKMGVPQEEVVCGSGCSATLKLLDACDCTIGALIGNLYELDRPDAANVVLSSAPLYKLRSD